MLSGEREVMERLDPLILEYQMKGILLPLCLLLKFASVVEIRKRPFQWIWPIFIRRDAPSVIGQVICLKYLRKKYPHLNLKHIDLNTADGKRLNETLSNRLSLPSEKRLIAPRSLSAMITSPLKRSRNPESRR